MASYTYSSLPAWRTSWFSIGVTAVLTVAGLGLLLLRFFEPPLQHWVAVGVLVLAGIVALSILFKHFEWRFVITGDVIESRRGIIGRELRSIRIQDLRNVNVRQSLWQRIFGVGDVEFSSAGGSDVEVVFFSIPDPVGLKDTVQELQERVDRVAGGD